MHHQNEPTNSFAWPSESPIRARRLLGACTAVVLFLGLFAVWLFRSTDPIDPTVRPTVERLERGTAPARWSFSYRPISASPYIACLGGVDEVEGAIDTAAGLVLLEPNRDAAPILVTASSLMIRSGPPELENWDEARLPDGDVRTTLTPILGEVLAGFVADGVRLPDPKMTALAALDIADSVRPAESLPGLSDDSFTVVVNEGEFVAELEAGGLAPSDDDPARIPTITVSVNDTGQVTNLIIRTEGKEGENEGRGGYVLTIEYDDVTQTQVPSRDQRQLVPLDEVNYPSPNESCAFGR